MFKSRILVLILILIQSFSFAQLFNNYFSTGSLRVDYIHTANSETEIISLNNFYHEPHWGGSEINLIDTFNYGHYKFEVHDSASNNMIYSRGYSSLCGEWRFTDEAKTNFRSFTESVILPFPKKTINIEFFKREKDQTWVLINTIKIDPHHYAIIPQLKTPIQCFKIHDSGESKQKLDIALLAEGYSQSEMQKFMQDAQRFTKYLLECAPFDALSGDINFWAVPSISQESGTDIPGEGVFKNTFFDSHFYTFGTERYINTLNNTAVRNAAANVPYDQIYILVNTDKYGGAGIYNYYSICTADNKYSDFVFTHEFGHAFAGLADEYYSSDVAVEDFYDLQTEPWEPNITTLVNFDKKWKSMLAENTPVPTPASIEDKSTIGAFEGGGYMEKGIYRPRVECSMKSIKYNYFCPVCSKAIVDRIKFYTR
jgi:hypothetical protein